MYFLLTFVSGVLFPPCVPVHLHSLISPPYMSHISLVSTALFPVSIDLYLIFSLVKFVFNLFTYFCWFVCCCPHGLFPGPCAFPVFLINSCGFLVCPYFLYFLLSIFCCRFLLLAILLFMLFLLLDLSCFLNTCLSVSLV